ncbi:NAD(P)/FAD-dependent oxidoreductase, partial [Streptomyces himastatinicus]|uniref:NAD(P)/FAD-dependent oxidoreductase n=1 Tax=Streptomyces himastatinicus TaxID=998084 RepID=UPI0001B50A39
DGTARAGVITAALGERASAAGVRFVPDARVTAIETDGGRVRSVRAGDREWAADDVVLACGIWGPAVAALAGVGLPLVPVGHPYVHGPRHTAPHPPSPFVRWPEHHVYARDHGDRDGLGTYDHQPLPVEISGLTEGADRPWPGDLFDRAIAAGLRLLPEGERWRPAQRLNGVFAMTPDNLPLIGPHAEVSGLWSAEAVWVTHAAGAAAALDTLMFDDPTAPAYAALAPDRFGGQPEDALRRRALSLYRDIYATA